METKINKHGAYKSYLNGKLHSFPYYDEETKSVQYHPALVSSRSKLWYKNGELHSYNDQPASIGKRNEEYYKDGQLHREGDKPAVIRKIKDEILYEEYRINGELHREGDKPALIRRGKNGIVCEQYRINGQLHRDGDNPAFISSQFTTYYKNNKLHRDGDKPAMIYKGGCVEYWVNDVLHRDGDKPAIVYKNGDVEYYKNGVKYSPKEEVIIVPVGAVSKELHVSKSEDNSSSDSSYNVSAESEESSGTNTKSEKNTITLRNRTITKKDNQIKKITPVIKEKTKNITPVIKNESVKGTVFELTTEDSIKFLLSCSDLSSEDKKELICNVLKDHGVIAIEEVIKFLLNCKNMDQKERQEVLRLTINKIPIKVADVKEYIPSLMDKLQFHPIPGRRFFYLNHQLVGNALFYKKDGDESYMCLGKIKYEHGTITGPFTLTNDEAALITSKGFEYAPASKSKQFHNQ